ncbi:hypothetical protein [Actinomadura sp. WMMB 499]|uniref:hypothetical protein n=1 Tax=Actinomadura sp. WMMB 499 TaxID=1219491 RepID=UPI0012473D2D|nr:hypothetical protein [Actinomadura sp. WMMB 499]QFG25581.1 hypothetical protein F7P10_35010 [Actinomadura sp. WMMB 499]
MKALIDLADLAARNQWARREHARLQADVVEARLAARAVAEASGPAARMRRWLTGGVAGRLGAARRTAGSARSASPVPVPSVHPVPGCRRAAARSFHVARTAGGTR